MDWLQRSSCYAESAGSNLQWMPCLYIVVLSSSYINDDNDEGDDGDEDDNVFLII